MPTEAYLALVLGVSLCALLIGRYLYDLAVRMRRNTELGRCLAFIGIHDYIVLGSTLNARLRAHGYRPHASTGQIVCAPTRAIHREIHEKLQGADGPVCVTHPIFVAARFTKTTL